METPSVPLKRRSWLRSCALGCGGTLLVLVVLGGAGLAWKWNDAQVAWGLIKGVMERPEYASIQTPDAMLTYVEAEQANVGLVTYTALPDGSPSPDEVAILHNADEPMALASTIKIVVLAAYAREVAAGRLDPNEVVPVAAWERYYLNGSDGGAHPAALEHLALPTDGSGYTTDPAATVRLDQLAEVMIQFSDNAATDFLLDRLGPDTLAATIEEAGMKGQVPPVSLAGLFLVWTNHEQPRLTPARATELESLSLTALAAEAERMRARFLEDAAWGNAERAWRAAPAAIL